MSEYKKAILVVSFGTSYEDTRRKNIDAIEERIGRSYKDYKIYRAFTSKMIIKKLKEVNDIHVNTVDQALLQMNLDGVKELIIQPTHIIHGIENDSMIDEVKKNSTLFEKIRIGTPLLSDITDYENVIQIIMKDYQTLEKDEVLVFMGHGSSHYSNSSYPALDYMLKEKGYGNAYVGTVEGYPSLEHIMSQIKRTKARKVILAPLMIVAGDHAINDMAGTEEDSWRTQFEQEGYEVKTILKGLGEYERIQEMFVDHIDKAKEIERES